MNRLKQLHWPLIAGMGALALARPLMNMTGMTDLLGKPRGPVLMTILISAAWLAIVVLARVRQPLLTLIFTGLSYGLFALVIGAILSPILTGELSGPLANPLILPFAVAGILLTNALWGGVVGIIAWGAQRAIGFERPLSQRGN